MAKVRLPDPLKRRHEVERNLDPARALALAEAYLAADRAVEAVAFLKKAGAQERLQALAEAAVEAGDAFLLREVSVALGSDPDARTWEALAARAEAAGKLMYAEEARRQAARVGQVQEA